jgi:hypothetical protein
MQRNASLSSQKQRKRRNRNNNKSKPDEKKQQQQQAAAMTTSLSDSVKRSIPLMHKPLAQAPTPLKSGDIENGIEEQEEEEEEEVGGSLAERVFASRMDIHMILAFGLLTVFGGSLFLTQSAFGSWYASLDPIAKAEYASQTRVFFFMLLVSGGLMALYMNIKTCWVVDSCASCREAFGVLSRESTQQKTDLTSRVTKASSKESEQEPLLQDVKVVKEQDNAPAVDNSLHALLGSVA